MASWIKSLASSLGVLEGECATDYLLGNDLGCSRNKDPGTQELKESLEAFFVQDSIQMSYTWVTAALFFSFFLLLHDSNLV